MNIMTHSLEMVEASNPRRPFRIADIYARVLLAIRVRRERNQLANLSDQQLFDIGITRDQAVQESARSLTDIPEKRRRSV